MTTLVLSLLRIQTRMVITKSHVGPATKHYTLSRMVEGACSGGGMMGVGRNGGKEDDSDPRSGEW